jgi:MFS family permease
MPTPFTRLERRTTLAIAFIMALRMLGLFMVLPLFVAYAQGLPGATPLLLGLSLGIYGLTQALLQIPFGMLSDYFGRKPLITIGLIIFTIGSICAASSHTIVGMLWGRSLQGGGAIGSTLLALVADTTRSEQRTKAMAIMGITIGGSFALAMLLGPLLLTWLTVPQIFYLSAGFAMVAIAILYTWIPSQATSLPARPLSQAWPHLQGILKNKELLRLNLGIFILHALLTATFIALPLSLRDNLRLISSQQWQVYLPTLLVSALLLFPLVGYVEKRQWQKLAFLSAILALSLSEFGLSLTAHSLLGTLLCLSLFFIAFNLLEATLPSLVSKLAPLESKGTAIGVYSCCQFLGIFAGGSLGGWVFGQFSLPGLWLASSLAAMLWFIIAFNMNLRGEHHGERHQ